MPITQLGQGQASGPGGAIGAAASIAGLVGGFIQGNAERKQRKAESDKTDAREDARAKDYHDEITSQVNAQNANAARQADTDKSAQLAQGAYAKYLPMLSSPPPGPDGKPLKGPALQNALTAIRNKAFSEGMTDDKHVADFNAEIARVMQQNAPKLSDVNLGPEPVMDGKAAWTPQKVQQYYAHAVTQVLSSDLPEDQKKIAIDTYTKMAANLLKEQPKQMTPYEQARIGIERDKLNHPRPSGGGGRGPDGLTPYERIENDRWNKTHNPDGTTKGSANRDTSGLSNAGKEAFSHDMVQWSTSGMDPNAQPDPSNPKYARRAAAGSGGGGGNTLAPKPVMHNGKPYYLHSDGNYYLTP
jgi:hypothetical protein